MMQEETSRFYHRFLYDIVFTYFGITVPKRSLLSQKWLFFGILRLNFHKMFPK